MLKKLQLSIALFIFFCSFFVGIDRFVHRKSSHFSLDKIHTSQQFSPEWELPPLTADEQKQLDCILGQKFTYLSKGSQSYVFCSEDDQYILKFFKQTKLRPRSWFAHIPLSFNPYYRELLFKQKKCQATFNACKTAYYEIKNESGLIYVHLNSSNHLNKKVVIYDKNHQPHTIDINNTTFYVQKRAQLIYSRISELMHHGDTEGAKNIITSVFNLLEFLGKKGIVDNDPIVRKNFGLIDDIAVQIDIGKMRVDPIRRQNNAYKLEVGSITHNFKNWIQTSYPELSEHFEAKLSETVR